ncbi:MAG: hypothetical protein ISR57_00740 [Bacteroidales bacterium]|nr:hypothetical protein [Bacteroidota bacterium]MBL6949148.1 hypothetical protein [Bacteroidales bacterium]
MKRSIRKIFKWILKLLLWFFGIILLVEAILYFLAPIYDFQEPEPFSGDQWYNPYHDIDTNNWRRANFHFHTYRWGGITSGKGTEQECYEQYKKLGYTISALSHYQYITEFQKDSPYYIPVYEHGFGIWKKHQLLIGAKRVTWLDYSLFQNINHKQHIINRLRPTSDIVTLAHPDWENGYTLKDMRYLSNYDLVEVLNNNWNSIKQWDAALSAGRPVYILGDDDGHNIYNPYVVGRRCTYVNSPTRNAEDIIHNLKTGNALGADIYMRWHEPFEEKEARAKMVPQVTDLFISNDTLFIQTDTVAMKFTFIGQNGKAKKVQYLTDDAWYILQPEDTYIRTNIVFLSQWKHPGTKFYLNPVFRYDGTPPVNKLTAKINWERTWIFRILTLGALAVGLYLVISYRWKKSHRKARS